jgi:hypothetical protein
VVIINEDDYLEHIGTPRHSGRYPWGSGEEGSTRHQDFLGDVAELKKSGLKDKDIPGALGMTSTQYRARITMANAEKKQAQVAQALKLHDKGMSHVAAAKQMGIPESTYRSLLKAGADDKANQLTTISNMLKQEADKKTYVDIGSGVENHLAVSKDRLRVAVAMAKEDGYLVHEVPDPQVTTGFDTNRKVLVPPGVTQRDVFLNRDKIQQLSVVSGDHGRTFEPDLPPLPIHPNRVLVKYAEDGGGEKDGIIHVRDGVPDVSLGKNRYAQVRVQVGKSHYLKGMAMYNDDIPEGHDLVFHTAKSKKDLGPDKLEAMKELTDDPTLPFGSVIKRQITEGSGPNRKVTSSMNLVNEEGDWKKWNRNISAQALSKQSPALAREQLSKTYAARKTELDEIMALNNPAVREKLLQKYAEATDKSAVHLKAAALDRQNWHVILPIETMKPTEIYAPKYNNGEKVALIRYPHGGKFEIPELTVNNRQPEAKRLLGDAHDAVGIHHSVAKHLSGADFDGDTILVIPNNHNKLKSTRPLDDLKDFDPQRLYKLPEGHKFSGNKQALMGDVSNLITDMTLQNAPHDQIAHAVKHSMVVIDAEKHDLDYRRSFRDNGIAALKERYQGRHPSGALKGAATLISRAKSQERVPDRKPRPYKQGGPINRETGQLEFVPSGKTRPGPHGTRIPKMHKTTKLAERDDAHSLVSAANTPMERIYADHSNRLKALANQARLHQINTPSMKRSSQAAKVYAVEATSLASKLALATRNSPLERQANTLANQAIRKRREANPDLKGDTLNKVKFQELEKARDRLGAHKKLIEITPQEWAAIQAGAISNSQLHKILDNADLEVVRKLATPRPDRMMTRAKTVKAQGLLDRGFTRAEVAQRLGVSVATLDLATIADATDEED